jgi:hypothetical protein
MAAAGLSEMLPQLTQDLGFPLSRCQGPGAEGWKL